jgi:hypothetical protein
MTTTNMVEIWSRAGFGISTGRTSTTSTIDLHGVTCYVLWDLEWFVSLCA